MGTGPCWSSFGPCKSAFVVSLPLGQFDNNHIIFRIVENFKNKIKSKLQIIKFFWRKIMNLQRYSIYGNENFQNQLINLQTCFKSCQGTKVSRWPFILVVCILLLIDWLIDFSFLSFVVCTGVSETTPTTNTHQGGLMVGGGNDKKETLLTLLLTLSVQFDIHQWSEKMSEDWSEKIMELGVCRDPTKGPEWTSTHWCTSWTIRLRNNSWWECTSYPE